MSSDCANASFYCGGSGNNVLRAFVTAAVCLAIASVLSAVCCYVRSLRRRRQRITSMPTVSPAPASAPAVAAHIGDGGGLDRRTIEALPVFMYSASVREKLECPVCLMEFKKGEKGRNLPKCGHRFHVECIDMWLGFHSSCPCCRAAITSTNDDQQLPV